MKEIQVTEIPDRNNKNHKRKIGELGGKNDGPVLIFIGGIHGNEPSGVFALEEIFEQYRSLNHQFHGKAFAFSGNLAALKSNQRYIAKDLNRLWDDEQFRKIENGFYENTDLIPEVSEQIELFSEFKAIVKNENGPFYFFDLHTTSAPSVPFILINDTLNNRKMAEKYPSRIILGIEEYLEGPMLSYINDQGHVSLGFEAGQHDDPKSLEVNKTFILQSFLLSGFMSDKKVYHDLIGSRRELPYAHSFFEVRHRYKIEEGEEFKMIKGYANFSKIKANQLLARNKDGEINSLEAGYLFMPLYQRKGGEGFYIIKLIPKFWLSFSYFLRRINFDYLLLVLPGVNRYNKENKTLVVNVRIARFLSRQIFHVLGYRRVKKDGFNLLFIKREFINPKYKQVNNKL